MLFRGECFSYVVDSFLLFGVQKQEELGFNFNIGLSPICCVYDFARGYGPRLLTLSLSEHLPLSTTIKLCSAVTSATKANK
jgi:hypothetical protein